MGAFYFGILLAAGFPILILIPLQILLTLKTTGIKWRLLPPLCCLGFMATALLLLPDQGITKLLIVCYCVLLLILCGAGFIIAWSILKSKRS